MRKKKAKFVIVAVVSIILLLGFVSNEKNARASEPDLHGAANSEDQKRALGVIQKGWLNQPPANVDTEIWRESIPNDNAMSEERVELGRELYFETALSADKTVSCATCHDVTRSFTDRRKVSEGVAKKTGKRNAPTTMNAALLQTQFWDGRAATLESQAGQPILNPVEMALSDKATAVAALQKIPTYAELFKKAYGRTINYPDIERAIAAFERTLIFLDAPFDRFIAGKNDAISESAKRGWDLYNGKARCITCHPIHKSNPLGTDNRFHNIGVSARHQDFEELAKRALKLINDDPSERKLDELAVGTDLSELGRFMVTKNYADIGSFRTPQIRNIGITGPYMHDGSLETLWDAMDHYNKGGEANPFLDGGIEPLALNEQEIDDLVDLMFTMTDVRFKELNSKEYQRQRAISSEKRPFRDNQLAQRKIIPFEKRVMKKR